MPRHVPLSLCFAILTFDKIARVGWGMVLLTTLFAFLVSWSTGSLHGDWLALALPAIFVVIALLNVNIHLHELELLRRGEQALAKFDRVEQRRDPRNLQPIGEPNVYLTFIDGEGQQHSISQETSATERLQGDEEIIFYDPHCLPFAVALDYLPGKLKLQGRTFQMQAPVWPYLVLPALAIASWCGLFIAVAAR